MNPKTTNRLANIDRAIANLLAAQNTCGLEPIDLCYALDDKLRFLRLLRTECVAKIHSEED